MNKLNEAAKKKIASYIGFARKSGGASVGCDITVDLIRRGARGKTPLIVLVSSDAAANTVKRARNTCEYYGVEYMTVPHTTDELGAIVGKASCSVVGIANVSLAKAISALADTKT